MTDEAHKCWRWDGSDYKCLDGCGATAPWAQSLQDSRWPEGDDATGIVTTEYETQRSDDMPSGGSEDEDKPFDAEAELPAGHPDTWTSAEWDEFEHKLDTLPLTEAIELEEAAWERLGITHGSVSDLVDSRMRAEESQAGKAKPKGPAKGSPCLRECRGPGWVAPKGYTGATNIFGTHLPRCPQHPDYDPNKDYGTPSYSTTTVSYKPSCKHDRSTKVKLENGLEIYATAHRDVKYLQAEEVDIGVYAYSGWQGSLFPFVSAGLDVPWAPARDTQAVILPWPDYGVPDNTDYMPDMIRWMLDLLGSGKSMEVACMGGHGRTGTLLAMLLVAQGLTPGEAIREARARHCKSAVESAKQCDYIAQFYEDFHGNSEWRKVKAQRKLFNRQKSSGKSGGSSKWSSGSSKGKTGFQGSDSTSNKPHPPGWSSTWKAGYTWSTEHGGWMPVAKATVTPITTAHSKPKGGVA